MHSLCIPMQFLKNWRTITLLNVIYKLALGSLAERMRTVLDKLINNDQTVFLKGRFIGESIRLIYNLMYYTEQNDIPGLLLFDHWFRKGF